MIDFPSSPTIGQIFNTPNGSFMWDGTKWVPAAAGAAGPDTLALYSRLSDEILTGSARAANMGTRGLPYGGFVSSYNNSTDGIDTVHSAGYLWDIPSKTQSQVRSNSLNIYQTSCSAADLATWTIATTSTGSVTHITASGADAWDFKTGATINSLAQVQKVVGSIPASFGIGYGTQHVAIGTNVANAVQIQLANVNGHQLLVRQTDNNIAIFINGAWTTVTTATLGNFGTEFWWQVTNNGGNNYTVALYLGTQFINAVTGGFPTGGTNGTMTIYVQNGATASREFYLLWINLGTSQLPVDMTLQSLTTDKLWNYNAPVTASGLKSIYMLGIVEDVSLSLLPGSNLFFDATIDGSTWLTSVPSKLAQVVPGAIDNFKPAYAFIATFAISYSGTVKLGYRVRIPSSAAYVYAAVLGVGITYS